MIPDYREEHAQLRAHRLPIEDECDATLQQFRSHGLSDRNELMLQNRTDAKYLMPMAVLHPFVQALKDDFNVLEIDGARIFTYENTYFDTPDHALYLAHHNGKLNRRKYRRRRYLETDTSFMECKLKVNQTRTIKYRFDGDYRPTGPVFEDWGKTHRGDKEDLRPALHVNYRRISLFNEHNHDRLTVDYDLRFKRPGDGLAYHLPDIFIAELKRREKLYGSPFYQTAKSYGFLPRGVSKYCIGTCLVAGSDIKRNRFKGLLSQLGRITTQETGEHD